MCFGGPFSFWSVKRDRRFEFSRESLMQEIYENVDGQAFMQPQRGARTRGISKIASCIFLMILPVAHGTVLALITRCPFIGGLAEFFLIFVAVIITVVSHAKNLVQKASYSCTGKQIQSKSPFWQLFLDVEFTRGAPENYFWIWIFTASSRINIINGVIIAIIIRISDHVPHRFHLHLHEHQHSQHHHQHHPHYRYQAKRRFCLDTHGLLANAMLKTACYK